MTINQLQLFIIFLINGIIVGFVFDFFRILRKSFKHSDYLIYIQDIIFWLLTGAIFLYSTFVFNDGEFRLFMIFAALIGFFLYIFTVSKIFINVNVNIILFLKKILIKIIKIFFIPLKHLILFVRKMFLKPVTFLVINMKRTLKSIKMSKNKKIVRK